MASGPDVVRGFARKVAELDARLEPIAKRPVDIFDPSLHEKARLRPSPLDEAGVRAEAGALLDELIDAYLHGDDDDRAEIRGLFARHRSFEWAAALPSPPSTAGSLRRHLLLFSMKDQGPDTRDAILELEHLCRTAAGAGVPIRPILEEVARISSDVNRHGMGSTRALIVHAVRFS